MSDQLNPELNEHTLWMMSTVLEDLIHNNSQVCPSGKKLENSLTSGTNSSMLLTL
jgi:hypothetical protein